LDRGKRRKKMKLKTEFKVLEGIYPSTPYYRLRIEVDEPLLHREGEVCYKKEEECVLQHSRVVECESTSLEFLKSKKHVIKSLLIKREISKMNKTLPPPEEVEI
jgi:hypothetical protein